MGRLAMRSTSVNSLTKQLADLNVQIRQREVDPKNHANTLRDQQDALLKQLAEKVNITSFCHEFWPVDCPPGRWPTPG